MEGIRDSAEGREALPTEAAGSALAAFAAAALELVGEGPPDRGLDHLLRAVALGTGAELVVARVADDHAFFTARAVHSDSEALAAELQGTRTSIDDVPDRELGLEDAPGDPSAPAPVRRAAARAGMSIVRLVPVTVDGDVVALLELYRSGLPFGSEEEALTRAAAAHVALALRLDRAAGRGRN
ncbi:MAG: GAF domain-containing protein, partial [Gaiellaceae bacterium]